MTADAEDQLALEQERGRSGRLRLDWPDRPWPPLAFSRRAVKD